ncbi:hypothetical protein EDC04DRAFT_2573486, partial [Pisolithus marmoratus]
VFSDTTDFTVVPQVERSYADVEVTFAVILQDHIVFVLELKPPSHFAFPSAREVADRQIRDRPKDVGSSCSLHCTHLRQLTVLNYTDCPLLTLHAISVMGTKLSFYTKDHSDPEDVVPVECWDCNIMEEEGARGFLAVVDEIVQGCAILQ